jgi:hypothetical protein
MDKKSNESRVYPWITFIAIVLLLLGIFGTARTVINMVAFDKYPSTGVYAFSFMMPGFYGQREQDCTYPQTYFTPDGKPRTPSKEEKEQEKIIKQNCLDGVREAREQAKVNDVSQSMLFLTLGIGLLVTRRFISR